MTFEVADDLRTTVSSEQESAGVSGLCCGSGCLVCVNDHSEVFTSQENAVGNPAVEAAELLDAIGLAHALLDGLDAEREIETEGDQ